MTSVSVIICSFNGEMFIEQQIRAVLTQSRPPDEIIVCDDRSTDRTVEIVHSIIEDVKSSTNSVINFHLFQNEETLGVTANFEKAINFASSEVIFLCDQDDYWSKDKIQHSIDFFVSHPNVLLIHQDAHLVDSNDNILKETLFDRLKVTKSEKNLLQSESALSVLIKRNLVTGATVAFKRELYFIAKQFPSILLHDEWLGLVASALGKSFLLDEMDLFYRQHQNNQVGVHRTGVRYAIGRITHPRTVRNLLLLERAKVVAQHKFLNFLSDEVRLFIKGKYEFENRRNSLPAARVKRILPIWKEWLDGGYNRYGIGLQDVIRDLFQPV